MSENNIFDLKKELKELKHNLKQQDRKLDLLCSRVEEVKDKINEFHEHVESLKIKKKSNLPKI